MGEVFPASWRNARALPMVLDFIVGLPLPPEDKKRVLFDWAAWAGVKVTKEMVERVTGGVEVEA